MLCDSYTCDNTHVEDAKDHHESTFTHRNGDSLPAADKWPSYTPSFRDISVASAEADDLLMFILSGSSDLRGANHFGAFGHMWGPSAESFLERRETKTVRRRSAVSQFLTDSRVAIDYVC